MDTGVPYQWLLPFAMMLCVSAAKISWMHPYGRKAYGRKDVVLQDCYTCGSVDPHVSEASALNCSDLIFSDIQ